MPFRTKLLDSNERETYRAIYQKICGTYIGDAYLHSQLVYGIYHGNRMVAGFIVGSESFRAVDQFVPDELKPAVYAKLHGLKVGEVCALWRDKTFKSRTLGLYMWASAAYTSMKTDNRIFLLGTFEPGLATLYSYPKYGHLIYEGPYGDDKRYWIFVGFKEDGLKAAVQLIWFNLRKKWRKQLGTKTPFSVKPKVTQESWEAILRDKEN